MGVSSTASTPRPLAYILHWPGDLGFGSASFLELNSHKVTICQRFLDLGVSELIMSDSDAIFVRDPRPFFSTYPEADILSHTDALTPTIGPGDRGLELPIALRKPLNVGLLVFRNREPVREFLEAWRLEMVANPKAWEQGLFNKLMQARNSSLPSLESYAEDERVFPAWNGSLMLGILPVAGFSPGPVAFMQRIGPKMWVPQVRSVGGSALLSVSLGRASPKSRKQEPELHPAFSLLPYTHPVYGTHKLPIWGHRQAHAAARGRSLGDPPEYYTAEFDKNNGFLSMELRWPEVPEGYADWNNSRAETMIVTHLNGMMEQLAQIRAGMAMAVALNRTFVMPKVELVL